MKTNNTKNEVSVNFERTALAKLMRTYGYTDAEIDCSLEFASHTGKLSELLKGYTDFFENSGYAPAACEDQDLEVIPFVDDSNILRY